MWLPLWISVPVLGYDDEGDPIILHPTRGIVALCLPKACSSVEGAGRTAPPEWWPREWPEPEEHGPQA